MKRLILTSLAIFFSLTVFSQANRVQFGKNRVQYHQDFSDWVMYESLNFVTYWYGEGRNIGQGVVLLAEENYEDVRKMLEFRTNDKIEIIVYKDLTDLKQSNIGSEELFVNTGGHTKIVGNKMFVYFDGDYNDLKRQIREGITSVFLQAMLFGSNLQEIVQNAVMLNLPEWFKQGLIAYVGEPWNSTLDNQLRDIVLSEKYKNFEEFAYYEPRLAGHSMWYYLSENYGQASLSNLLYLTRINRSLEAGYLYVLGNSFDATSIAWKGFFEERFAQEEGTMSKPDSSAQYKYKIKNKRELPLSQARISPDGKRLAYVSNNKGKAKVYVLDLETGERTMVFKTGFKNLVQATDYNYPLLAWRPNNQELAIIYEKRDIIKLVTLDIEKWKLLEEQEIPNQYQRIYSMDFMSNNKLVLTAAFRGFSDVFIYRLNTRASQRLTNDYYDDRDAVYVENRGRKGILFSSNRTGTSLERVKLDTISPGGAMDLYFYHLKETEGELIQVTYTQFLSERQPVALDSEFFSYLSDENGLQNRRKGYIKDILARVEKNILTGDDRLFKIPLDSIIPGIDTIVIDSIWLDSIYEPKGFSFNQTNYPRSILGLTTAPKSKVGIQHYFVDQEHYFMPYSLDNSDTTYLSQTRFALSRIQQVQLRTLAELKQNKLEAAGDRPSTIINPSDPIEQVEPQLTPQSDLVVQDTGIIDIDNYFFQSEFEDDEIPELIEEETDIERALQKIEEEVFEAPPVAKREPPRFISTRIVPYRLKFQSDYFTTQADMLNTLRDPSPGLVLENNVKDLFEDYVITGGVRFPFSFNGAEYYLFFDDKKKRLDKQWYFYRRSQKQSLDGPFGGVIQLNRFRETTIEVGNQLRYPLDIYRSIRSKVYFREDRRVQLATDLDKLQEPTLSIQQIALGLEYVFDNTVNKAINIKHGTQYKVYTEFQKPFLVNFSDGVAFAFTDGFTGILGLDARHFQRIDRNSILALRVAGATTFGTNKYLYSLGGNTNLFNNGFAPVLPAFDGNTNYQVTLPEVRGFEPAVREGNSYVSLSTELRMPVFKYLSRRLRSSFLKNFQLLAFFDAGTAWVGSSPFDQDNPLNIETITDPTGKLTVRVKYFRDPFVFGYGFGFRTVLFGYFLGLDYAWGVETRVVQKPRVHLSIGTSF